MKEFFKEKRGMIFSIGKYLFSVILACLALMTIQNPFFLIVSLLELVMIACLTNWIARLNKVIAYVLNVILIFLFNAQQLVMFFGGSYTTLIMVTNLESLESLSGRMVPILVGTILLLVFTLLPVSFAEWKKGTTTSLLSLVLMAELAFTFLYGNNYSPLFAVYRLGLDAKEYQQQMEAIKNQPNITKDFYKPEVKSSRERPDTLSEKPNIVLIFVEGLSQNIIDDSRNVMPNVRNLQSKSLNFTNYYNHTFATYRGLIGQLYSGYQLNNYDSNTLVSVQDILADNGYQTTFINTEPSNTQFTSYLESLKFEELLTDSSLADGINGSLTDEAAFDVLYETIEKQEKEKEPFFTTMYTYGTHMSFDSADKKFKSGEYPVLNRFYNFDYYFNEFMTKFNKSKLADNTLLIFTTDHATFEDSDFKAAYPKYQRGNPDVDNIPLFFYYKGMKAEELDVKGRNSLSLAPTLLDYLDISAPNYFLGQSLFFFKENNNSYDTVFYDNSYLLSTDYAKIAPISEVNQKTVQDLLEKYFAAKTQPPMTP